MEIVYHGCAIRNAAKLATAIREGRVTGLNALYVTDTSERAARYANAQASGEVSVDATTPGEHTAIFVLRATAPVRWRTRTSGASLDEREGLVQNPEILEIRTVECSYRNCTCHGTI